MKTSLPIANIISSTIVVIMLGGLAVGTVWTASLEAVIGVACVAAIMIAVTLWKIWRE